MKKTTFLLAMAVAGSASAQISTVPAEYSGSWFYDIRTKTSSAVVLTKIGTITSHSKALIDFYGFAGAQFSGGSSALVGGAIGKSFYLADQVNLFVGVGVSMPATGRWGGGALVGIAYHF